MRCSVAAIQALAMHPRYRQRDGIMQEAMGMAESLFREKLDCSFILNMPVENVRAILELRREYGGWCDSNVRNGLIAKRKVGEL